MEFGFVLPVPNATIKRRFSFYKAVQTDWQASLSSERLSTLLRIKVEGKPCQNYTSKAVGEKSNDQQNVVPIF